MRTIEYIKEKYKTPEYIILDDETRYGWKLSAYEPEDCRFIFFITVGINGCTISRFINVAEKWMFEKTDLDTIIFLTFIAEDMIKKYKHLDPSKE